MAGRLLTPGRRVLLKPATAIISSALTFLILVLATRKGMFPDIAAYTAGASVGAIVSAVAGSGTSLAYVTGDADTQRAVRKVRFLFVVPMMLLGACGAGVLYSSTTDLALLPVVLGGVTVVLNNMAELSSAALERKMKTPQMLVATIVSRSIGLAVLLSGGTFSSSMLLCSAIGCAILSAWSRADIPQTGVSPSFRQSLKVAYRPSLMGVSVLEIVIARAALLVIPFIVEADVAGAASSLISAQQSITAILGSAFYTMMAATAEGGGRKQWMQTVSRRTMGLAMLSGPLAALAVPLVIRILGLESFSGAGLWWVLLSLAMPAVVANRRLQFELLGEGRRSTALQLLTVNAAVGVIPLAVGVAIGSLSVAISSSLVSETVAAVSLRLWLGRRMEGRE